MREALGSHGAPLLAHAKGGAEAAAVVEILEPAAVQGDATDVA